MRAGDFVGVKVYRKPAEDKRTKKDGTPRSIVGGTCVSPTNMLDAALAVT